MTEAGLRESRRRLAIDGLGIIASAAGFGFVFGLAAAEAGFSLIEAIAFSVIVFAGAAQFAAVGYIASGVGWPAIILLTAFLNARHILYSAALAPWLSGVRRPTKAAMAHLLTDEAFALTIAHFGRIGRADPPGYWYAAIVTTFIPWNIATIAGALLGQSIASPETLGLDVIFPAAMAGLAIGLATGRREVVAALSGGIVAVAVALAWDPAGGIVIGGLVGPLLGLAMPARDRPPVPPAPFGTLPAEGQEAIEGETLGRDPEIGVAP